MTEKLDGLPETIVYGGHKAEYAGTTTFKAGGSLWYRHEYAYCDAPHVMDRVCFYRIEGDKEPIPEVTEFELSRDPGPRRRASQRDSQKAYLDPRRKKRDEKRQQQANQQTQKALARRIRGQIKPFGGE